MISAKDLSLLEKALPQMEDREKRKNLALLREYQKEMKKEIGVESFLDFIKHRH